MEDIVASKTAVQLAFSFSRIMIQIRRSVSTEVSLAEDISASTHQTSSAGVAGVTSVAEVSPGQARMMRCSMPGLEGRDCQWANSASLVLLGNVGEDEQATKLRLRVRKTIKRKILCVLFKIQSRTAIN